jgi:lysophospholipase L1-like esterase
MNQGLGGNRILHDIRGDSGLRRFDRDVLAQPGVTHTVIMLGTNDLRNRPGKPEEEVTAAQMIAGLKQFAVRGQARGIRVIGGTLTPFENETFLPGAWNPRREAVRQEVNEWLRKGDAFDAIVDFDRALRDPDHPTRMLPKYDCGDHLHPSDLGAVARWATRSISRCSRRSHEHAALRTILAVAGWNTERARAVEITRVGDQSCPRRSASARPAPPRSRRSASPSPSCGSCAPGVARRSRSIPGKRPPHSAARIT